MYKILVAATAAIIVGVIVIELLHEKEPTPHIEAPGVLGHVTPGPPQFPTSIGIRQIS